MDDIDELPNRGVGVSVVEAKDLKPPCAWDSMEPCEACRKTRCATCAMGKPCESCAEGGIPQTCYAFCELDTKVCEAQNSINFSLWQETYAAVRCLKDRSSRDRDSTTDIGRFYPGFCKQHNDEQQEFVQLFWHRLPERSKVLLNYIINGTKCSLIHYEQFLEQNRELFQDMTVYDVMQTVLSPAGIMAVDPIYLQLFITNVIDKEQTNKVAQHPEFMQRLRDPNFNNQDADQWIEYFDKQFQTERHEYRFIVDGILQEPTLRWLINEEEACIRNLRWNMLFYKIFMSFIFCFIPIQVKNTIPAFRSTWTKVWANAEISIMEQLSEGSQRERFKYHWDDFMENMTNMVAAIDSIMEQVPQPDKRPIVNPFSVMKDIGVECKP